MPRVKQFGFPKTNRLHSKRIINQVFQTGQYRKFGILQFKFLPHRDQEAKIVISISKRVGNSPQRNYLKRLIRESLRSTGQLRSLPIDCGIFVTRPLLRKPTRTEIQNSVERFIASLSNDIDHSS